MAMVMSKRRRNNQIVAPREKILAMDKQFDTGKRQNFTYFKFLFIQLPLNDMKFH